MRSISNTTEYWLSHPTTGNSPEITTSSPPPIMGMEREMSRRAKADRRPPKLGNCARWFTQPQLCERPVSTSLLFPIQQQILDQSHFISLRETPSVVLAQRQQSSSSHSPAMAVQSNSTRALSSPPILMPFRVPWGTMTTLFAQALQNQLHLNWTCLACKPYFKPFFPSNAFPRCDAQMATSMKHVAVKSSTWPWERRGHFPKATENKKRRLIWRTSIPRQTKGGIRSKSNGKTRDTTSKNKYTLCIPMWCMQLLPH